MINPSIIEKCKKIAEGKVEVKRLPKNFPIDAFLINNRFYGDKFLDPNGKQMIRYKDSVSYLYFNEKINTEVELFYNKKHNSINAIINFKDYGLTFSHLSLKKLVHIIDVLNG